MTWNAYEPFPTPALGRRLGLAVQQHHVNTKIAVELIAPIALAAASVPVSALFDAKRPNCAPSPTNLFTLVLADSGEAKDFGSGPFIAPLLKFQARHDEDRARTQAAAAAELRIWKAHDRRFDADIKECLAAGKPTGELQVQLAMHLSRKPKATKPVEMLFTKGTPEAITESLCANPRSAAFCNMEGGKFLKTLSTTMTFWNELWTGAPIHYQTRTHGRESVRDPHMSLILGVQPEVFARSFRRIGIEAQGSGLYARMLFSFPPSTAGWRLISDEPYKTDHLDSLAARFTELLEAGAKRVASSDRAYVEFTPGAARCFVEIYNRLMVLMRPGQPYSDIRPQAAKAAENVARVAVILHVVDDLPGLLEEETLVRAAKIVEWHVNSFMMAYLSASPQARAYQDGEALLQGLLRAHSLGQQAVAHRDLKHLVPGDIRPARIGKALHMLTASGQASTFRVHGREFVAAVRTSHSLSRPRVPDLAQ